MNLDYGLTSGLKEKPEYNQMTFTMTKSDSVEAMIHLSDKRRCKNSNIRTSGRLVRYRQITCRFWQCVCVCMFALTTGLSMMPFRKIKSRSLAVVLSLSVSRTLCIAEEERRTKQQQGSHKSSRLIQRVGFTFEWNSSAVVHEIWLIFLSVTA